MIVILALGAVWTTVLALHHGGALMWPVSAWLWLTTGVAAARWPDRRRQPSAARNR
jgi:uncharacterized membrane protein YoaK (UPF0700 family)